MRKLLPPLLIVALAVALLPPTPALAAPAIHLLNPSDYTTGPPFNLSARTDADNTYHLVAWVKDPPSNPIVEFELRSATSGPLTFTGERVGSDTFHADLSLASINDGAYTLSAILYQDQDEVVSTSTNVTVRNANVPPGSASHTVEMTWPSNGGALGFYAPPGKAATTVIDTTASDGVNQVRALYTLTDPGEDPAWLTCGAGETTANRTARVRCTLRSGTNPNEVSAVAVVSNMTPGPAEPNPAADQTGDAHRVLPYTSKPTRVQIDPDVSSKNPNTEGDECAILKAFVFDQQNRPLVVANVDVHATGPGDQLRFGVDSITQGSTTNRTDGYQAPDKNHGTLFASARCQNGEAAPADSNFKHAQHRRIGADDTVHIESTTGTDTDGRFDFALHSSAIGTTEIEAWADEDDDDRLGVSEASGGARLGWGQQPDPPQPEVVLSPESGTPTTGECHSFTLVSKLGGNPTPSANVDVHAKGPDASVAFCDPGGGSASRPPDQNHSGDVHPEDGTRHIEGETDSAGRFVFGVTSPTEGVTDILAWRDSTDDDLLSSEASDSAQLTWQPVGERTISIRSSKPSVTKGRRVRLLGHIEGSPACQSEQTVELLARPAGSRKFKLIATSTTDQAGDYSIRVTVRKTTTYKAQTPEAGTCSKAVSGTVKVKAKKKQG